jgi:hypothetical protein
MRLLSSTPCRYSGSHEREADIHFDNPSVFATAAYRELLRSVILVDTDHSTSPQNAFANRNAVDHRERGDEQADRGKACGQNKIRPPRRLPFVPRIGDPMAVSFGQTTHVGALEISGPPKDLTRPERRQCNGSRSIFGVAQRVDAAGNAPTTHLGGLFPFLLSSNEMAMRGRAEERLIAVVVAKPRTRRDARLRSRAPHFSCCSLMEAAVRGLTRSLTRARLEKRHVKKGAREERRARFAGVRPSFRRSI